jgi:hypothetical protein
MYYCDYGTRTERVSLLTMGGFKGVDKGALAPTSPWD